MITTNAHYLSRVIEVATTLADEVGPNAIALRHFTVRAAGTSDIQDSPALAMAEWPIPASADLRVYGAGTASLGRRIAEVPA
jgi:hypothetical protein